MLLVFSCNVSVVSRVGVVPRLAEEILQVRIPLVFDSSNNLQEPESNIFRKGLTSQLCHQTYPQYNTWVILFTEHNHSTEQKAVWKIEQLENPY